MPRILVDNVGQIGAVYDLPPYRLPVNAWSRVEEFRFTPEGAVPVRRDREIFVGGDPSLVPTWYGQFGPTALPYWLSSIPETTAGGADGILEVAGPGLVNPLTNVTRVSSNYSTKPDVRPHGFVFQGLGIWNNLVDIPQHWSPPDGATALDDLPNWSTNQDGGATIRCNFMRPHKNFLIYGKLTGSGGDFPFRVRWSDAAEPGTLPSSYDTTDATKLAGEFDFAETSDYVVDGLTLNETFMVYKERSTWGMQFTGTTFRRWKIFDTIGVLTRDCVAAFPGGHFVVAQDDIVIHQGTPGSARSILDNRLQKWLFSNISPLWYYNSYVVLNTPDNEIWFCFPRFGQVILGAQLGNAVNQAFADTALIWNWEDNSIGFRRLAFGVPFLAAGPIGADTTTGELLTWDP